MPQDNSIPNKIWGGPSPVDSFISGRNAAQDYNAKQATMDRNAMIQGREDEQYDYEKNARSVDQLGAVLDQVKDGDVQGFEQAKAFAVQNGLVDQASAARYTVNDLGRLRAMSQQARGLAAQRQKQAMDERGLALDESRTKAQNAASYASADASRASAEKSRMAPTKPPAGMVPGPPDAQGNPTFIPKLNDDQAKATGFANRIQSANAKIEKFGDQLMDWRQAAAGSAPYGIGNTLVSSKYQQAKQAVRDFINAQLRRESGAVIADSEFANAFEQYIPQVGDGKEVLAQKKEARALAFRNMRTSSGPGVANIEAPPADAAPPAGDGPQEGDTGTSKSGKATIFRNGKWLYR